MTDPIVVLAYARTPMGAMQGALSALSVTELGSVAIRAAVERAGVQSDQVDQVLMGCVLPAGVGQAPARQAALKAGLPQSTLCTTVNKVCGSGMKTVMMATQALSLGQSDLIVAGGMESMSNAPYMLSKARDGYRLGHGELKDHMFTDGLEDAYEGNLMGCYAEATAEKYGFSREEQDQFAIASLDKAKSAIEAGKFEQEIAPVTIKSRKGDIEVTTDESPGNAKPEKIPQLRPAFKKDGTVTAANSSSISDGAAVLVLTRESVAKANGWKPLAKICEQTEYAHEPEWFTTAPCSATQNLLDKLGWKVGDVDLFEVNEAFAVVTLAAIKELGLPPEKVNVNGGACALGHPLGASGARIIVTLLNALSQQDKKRGIASLCIGGGEATAIALELLD